MNWVMAMYVLAQFYNVRNKGEPAENREKSIDFYKQAMSVWTKESVPLNWAMTMHELGKAYIGRVKGNPADNNERAIECFEQALSIRKKEVVPMDWAASMCELGSAYSSRIKEDPQEREEKAIDRYNQALSVLTQDVVPLKWAEAKYGLAIIYAQKLSGVSLDNHQEAVRCCRAALAVVNEETNPQLSYLARFGMGYSLFHQSQLQNDRQLLEESFGAFGEALRIISSIYIDIADPKARKDFLRQRITQFHGVIGYLLQQDYCSDAMYWLEKIRSQGLLEDINLDQLTPHNERAAGPARKYWETCRDIRTLRAALAIEKEEKGMQFDSRTRLQQQESYNQLRGYLSQRNVLLQELRDLDPEYVNLIQAEPLTEQELYELLSATGSAAVECFSPGGSTDLHFLVAYKTDSGIAFKPIKQGVNSIFGERTLDDFLKPFRDDCLLPELASLSTVLEDVGKMIQPLATFLSEKGIQRIYLSPHGFLHAIPFHAGFLPDLKTYFIENFEVCYTPSLTLSYRLFCSKAHAGKKAMVLFFDPPEKGESLVQGKMELADLPDLYGKEQVIFLEDEEATMETLATKLQNMQEELSLVEFICHGAASSEGIFLHLADGPVSHVDMIRKLNFNGLPLAVLTACETGRSDEWTRTYEEYVALDSVFLQMGARGVVSSLYPIVDQGTYEIMKEFHRRVKNDGLSPIEALHDAQRKILKEGFTIDHAIVSRGRDNPHVDQASRQRWSTHPYYWAFLKYSGTFQRRS